MYPEAALAVTVTLVPQVFVPPPLVVPPAPGELLVVIAYVVLEKFATKVRFAFAVNV